MGCCPRLPYEILGPAKRGHVQRHGAILGTHVAAAVVMATEAAGDAMGDVGGGVPPPLRPGSGPMWSAGMISVRNLWPRCRPTVSTFPP